MYYTNISLYSKRYFIVGLIIKNDDVYEHIIESKAARGRFIDYSLRRLIKPIVYSDLDICCV